MTHPSVNGNIWKTSLPIYLLAYVSIFAYYYINVSSLQIHSAKCKVNWAMSGYSKRYWAQPGVSILVRSWCVNKKNQVDIEQMLRIDKSINFPDGICLFMGRGGFKTFSQPFRPLLPAFLSFLSTSLSFLLLLLPYKNCKKYISITIYLKVSLPILLKFKQIDFKFA